MRLGLCSALLPVAWWIDRFHAFVRATWPATFSAPDVPGRVITTLGRSSLFVYWIHVEMAYGSIALPLRRSLPLELSLLGTATLCAVLYLITRWKDETIREVDCGARSKSSAPSCKSR